MVTKTLTITEDAYRLLSESKLESESFSEEIRRLFGERKKKKLMDFFGILKDDKGAMQKDLEKVRAMNMKLLKKRLRDLYETA